MRRRSRRNRPIHMLGAFLVEAGAMLAIVALAQPTWTRHLIEQISPVAPASANSAVAKPVVSLAEATPVFSSMQAASPKQATPAQDNSGGHQAATSSVGASAAIPAMQPARGLSQRLAMTGWSASSVPANEYSAAPQYSHYSVDPYASSQHYLASPQVNPLSAIRPIYPPPATSQSMPAWSNSY